MANLLQEHQELRLLAVRLGHLAATGTSSPTSPMISVLPSLTNATPLPAMTALRPADHCQADRHDLVPEDERAAPGTNIPPDVCAAACVDLSADLVPEHQVAVNHLIAPDLDAGGGHGLRDDSMAEPAVAAAGRAASHPFSAPLSPGGRATGNVTANLVVRPPLRVPDWCGRFGARGTRRGLSPRRPVLRPRPRQPARGR